MSSWPVEEIPDQDSLFYRVSVGWVRPDLKVAPGIFRENKGSISTDWEKYSTASETRARPGKPQRFAILRLIAGPVREIDELTVSHSPVQNVGGNPDNRAHSDIFGLDAQASGTTDLGRKEKIRTELKQRFNSWEIPPNAPVE